METLTPDFWDAALWVFGVFGGLSLLCTVSLVYVANHAPATKGDTLDVGVLLGNVSDESEKS